ncbi:MAG: hypothetical protein IPM16_23240 [Chloroflexi bacterium]|nr:hypothetical protein [Chloroflexota bacterium]
MADRPDAARLKPPLATLHRVIAGGELGADITCEPLAVTHPQRTLLTITDRLNGEMYVVADVEAASRDVILLLALTGPLHVAADDPAFLRALEYFAWTASTTSMILRVAEDADAGTLQFALGTRFRVTQDGLAVTLEHNLSLLRAIYTELGDNIDVVLYECGLD